ncbi:MAG: sulfite exporter TauE/SafE family protein [Oscillospiraceae bacterium]|nr:sulfite exporter TauE/SafE family protein [Oscillospiraceae bacterium]
MREFIVPFLLGAAMGVLSGWGVGGGTLLTVCLTLFLGVEHRQAQAVNLLFFLPTAALSLWFHRKNGLIDREVWAQTSIPGMVAALLFAPLALAVDVTLLRKPFGIFLLVSAVLMLGSARKK